MTADSTSAKFNVYDVKLDETPQVNGNEEHRAANEAEVASSSTSPPLPSTQAASTMITTPLKLPVVAVDLDEVLGQFVPRLCSFHNDTYGTALTPEAFTCYDFHKVWGSTKEEADSRMRMFFESPYFLENGRGIPVVDGAMEVLTKHVGRIDFHIVTSRQNILEEHTRDWVEVNFPGIFTELHFGNHHSRHGEVRSKPGLCRAIDAVMIIDDNVLYATQCAEAGIHTCLFGNYAWNRASDQTLPSSIRRTCNWEEVDAILCSLEGEMDPGEAAAGPRATGTPEASAPGQGGGAEAKAEAKAYARIGREREEGDTKETEASPVDGDEIAGDGGGTAAAGGDNGVIEAVVDGVIITTSTGVPVIAVEASKTVASLVELASAQLVQHEAVCLRSLEKAVMVGVDAVQELERLGVAVKSQVRTSLVELSSGSRTCVEVTVKRTPQFVEGLAAAAGDVANPSLNEGPGTGQEQKLEHQSRGPHDS